tara:strand:+ start:5086 stop:6237 length:1152 start_codon:yes stop_codon:yes gene_type:complete
MKNKIAMIPARSGSKRVPKKNIRLINNKPLIDYCIKSAIDAKIFDQIYINTDDKLIMEYVKKFYPTVYIFEREAKYATDSATNDDFMFDFLTKVSCYSVMQILPTSPFISSEDIIAFDNEFHTKSYKTLISVKENKIECIYKNKPINFNKSCHTLPSQKLNPIFSYACSLMIWDSKTFIGNYKENKGPYHGGNSDTGYFELKGYSTIDIDNEEDFIIAEFVAKALSNKKVQEKRYYSSNNLIHDSDVTRILPADGILNNVNKYQNKMKSNIYKIIESMPKESSWSYTLVNSTSNRSTLLAQMPGEGNRRHYHEDWDEWWLIIKGEWEFDYNNKILFAKKGDLIFLKRNTIHKIKATGDQLSIRMAVSRDDVEHIYLEEDYKNE